MTRLVLAKGWALLALVLAGACAPPEVLLAPPAEPTMPPPAGTSPPLASYARPTGEEAASITLVAPGGAAP